MTGYRQSSFDPNAGSSDTGPPLKPYNWVQWTGVAIVCVGAAGCFYFLLEKAGVVPKLTDDAMPFAILPIIGTTLVNSRRAPGQAHDAEALRRRRTLAITLAIVAVILGVVIAIFVSKGAQ